MEKVEKEKEKEERRRIREEGERRICIGTTRGMNLDWTMTRR